MFKRILKDLRRLRPIYWRLYNPFATPSAIREGKMDTQEYYSTKEASDLTGASKQIIRVYTQRYARYLSTEGTPEPGKPRRFTEGDLKLLAYVYQQTSTGNMTHEQVLESLAQGALDRFDWSIPTQGESAQEQDESAQSAPNALIPVERFQAAQALLMDAQRREQEAREQAQALQDKVNQLERELGQAQGTIQVYQAQTLQERVTQLERELGQAQGALETFKKVRKRPRWWVALFGGE